jgi:Xaa-Pro aminopeptidase
MRLKPLPPEFFSKNRTRLKEMLEPGSMAVICGGQRVSRSGTQLYPFRQQSDFFYLSGINREDSVLILLKDASERIPGEILFMRFPDQAEQLWTGRALEPAGATRLSGISLIRSIEDLDSTLDDLAPSVTTAYFNHPPSNDPPPGSVSGDEKIYRRFTARFPVLNTRTLSPLMIRLRMIKSAEEVEAIRQACRITGSAFRRALGILRPGVTEYALEAELTAEFIRQGTGGHAFEPIVAGGSNALILHYTQNSGTCAAGDLLLMDFGAEVNNYAADCTRTVPVNGRFTKRQREVYDAVVRVFKQARSMMVPGMKLSDLHRNVGRLWEEEHIRLGLYTLEEARNAQEQDPLWKKYFMHNTSHSLGLDVHDPFDRSVSFEPGMVLTCEPAIYLPRESTGIRIENDILITTDRPVDLTEDIPLEAAEIEALMQELAPPYGTMESHSV